MPTSSDPSAAPGATDPDDGEPTVLPVASDPGVPTFAEAWAADAEPDVAEPDVAPIVGAGVPAVVAVIVTRNPGPWLESTVQTLAAQEYANLATLVVDAGSLVDPADRVAVELPNAFVKRVPESGYAAAANAAAESVEGAAFLLLLHDDVALGPGTVQAMVEEAFRSNAGVVGAKLVDWDEPERLRSVGAAIDKFGFAWPVAEPGELDQAQHDAVRDVFVVSTAAMLVRCDLFADLGGFATDLDGSGEDLDLCWRARVAGARTVVTPAAVVRHRERSELGDPTAQTAHLALRHQIRTVLANYSWPHLLRVVVQAMVLAGVDIAWSLARGRIRQAAEIGSALSWNVAHLPTTWAVRRRVARLRRVPDREIRSLQIRGSARVVGFVRGQRANGNLSLQAAFAAARTRSLNRDDDGPWRLVAFLVLAVVVLVGSRGLISGTVPAVREFVALGRPADSWREWWSGWRSAGLGAAEGAPTLLGVLGGLEWLAAGFRGALRTAVFLSPVAVGGWATFRGLRHACSPVARVAALAVFLANPLLHDAIAEGRWQAMVVTAVVPMVVVRVARAGGWAPFGGAIAGSVQRQAVDLGLTLAAAALVAPLALPVAVGVALVVAAVQFAAAPRGARDAALVVTGGVVLATVVHLPWVVTLLGGSDRWTRLVGRDASAPDWPSMGDLLLLRTGPHGGHLSIGLLIPVVAALLLARRERWRWAAVGALLVVASWAAVVLAGRQLGSHALPAPELLAAPLGFGLALAFAFGVDALRTDVAGRAFGGRQLLTALAAMAATVGALPFLGTVIAGGRWSLPTTDLAAATAPLRSGPGGSRTLWIGVPDALPAAGRSLGPGLGYALTEGAAPSLSALHPAGAGEGEAALAAALRRARQRATARLGAELGRFGVRYVVVTDRVVPPPGSTSRWEVDAAMRDALADQLDLQRVEVVPGLVVYENLAARPVRAAVPDDQVEVAAASVTTATDTDTRVDLRPALPVRRDPTGASGPVAADDTVVVAANRDDGWTLAVGDRRVAARPFGGWAMQFDVPRTGRGTVSFATPTGMLLAHVLQIAVLGALPWVRRRRVSEGRRRVARTAPGGERAP